jgi:hypothetical protein
MTASSAQTEPAAIYNPLFQIQAFWGAGFPSLEVGGESEEPEFTI